VNDNCLDALALYSEVTHALMRSIDFGEK